MTVIDFTSRLKQSNLSKAQELVYEAHATTGVRKRVQLAKAALELSPLCAEAYEILGHSTRSQKKALEFYEKAVLAAEELLGDGFEDMKGDFWSFIETRPYMRAKAQLADELWGAGFAEESIKHYKDMIELNPNDNQGVRYILASQLLFLNKLEELDHLLQQYDSDCDATWPYTRLLLNIKRHGISQQLEPHLLKAIKSNKHVPTFLIDRTQLPTELPAFISMGGESEAVSYVAYNLDAWQQHPEALEWLEQSVANMSVV
ncbi:MAG: hypothetical protein CMD81_06990 [Gammaproteobacteria bacterium]|nr:hypothetical protein [Gammaproteobacteria bacterium]